MSVLIPKYAYQATVMLRAIIKHYGIEYTTYDDDLMYRTQINHDGWYESIITGYGSHTDPEHQYEYACCYEGIGCMEEPAGHLTIEDVLQRVGEQV